MAIIFQSIFMNDSSLSALTAQLGLITHPKTSGHMLQGFYIVSQKSLYT